MVASLDSQSIDADEAYRLMFDSGPQAATPAANGDATAVVGEWVGNSPLHSGSFVGMRAAVGQLRSRPKTGRSSSPGRTEATNETTGERTEARREALALHDRERAERAAARLREETRLRREEEARIDQKRAAYEERRSALRAERATRARALAAKREAEEEIIRQRLAATVRKKQAEAAAAAAAAEEERRRAREVEREAKQRDAERAEAERASRRAHAQAEEEEAKKDATLAQLEAARKLEAAQTELKEKARRQAEESRQRAEAAAEARRALEQEKRRHAEAEQRQAEQRASQASDTSAERRSETFLTPTTRQGHYRRTPFLPNRAATALSPRLIGCHLTPCVCWQARAEREALEAQLAAAKTRAEEERAEAEEALHSAALARREEVRQRRELALLKAAVRKPSDEAVLRRAGSTNAGSTNAGSTNTVERNDAVAANAPSGNAPDARAHDARVAAATADRQKQVDAARRKAHAELAAERRRAADEEAERRRAVEEEARERALIHADGRRKEAASQKIAQIVRTRERAKAIQSAHAAQLEAQAEQRLAQLRRTQSFPRQGQVTNAPTAAGHVQPDSPVPPGRRTVRHAWTSVPKGGEPEGASSQPEAAIGPPVAGGPKRSYPFGHTDSSRARRGTRGAAVRAAAPAASSPPSASTRQPCTRGAGFGDVAPQDSQDTGDATGRSIAAAESSRTVDVTGAVEASETTADAVAASAMAIVDKETEAQVEATAEADTEAEVVGGGKAEAEEVADSQAEAEAVDGIEKAAEARAEAFIAEVQAEPVLASFNRRNTSPQLQRHAKTEVVVEAAMRDEPSSPKAAASPEALQRRAKEQAGVYLAAKQRLADEARERAANRTAERLAREQQERAERKAAEQRAAEQKRQRAAAAAAAVSERKTRELKARQKALAAQEEEDADRAAQLAEGEAVRQRAAEAVAAARDETDDAARVSAPVHQMSADERLEEELAAAQRAHTERRRRAEAARAEEARREEGAQKKLAESARLAEEARRAAEERASAQQREEKEREEAKKRRQAQTRDDLKQRELRRREQERELSQQRAEQSKRPPASPSKRAASSPLKPTTPAKQGRPQAPSSASPAASREEAPASTGDEGEAAASGPPRRFAAANPQLARALDPKSGLADNYSLLGVLGKGSYGEVKLAIHKLTKRRVAVKTIARAKLTDAKLRRRAEAEVEIHSRLRHRHIARLFEVIYSTRDICLCMQFAPGGTLRELLDASGPLSEERARRYSRQLLGALCYCHGAQLVVHRDLKLDNLLLDADDNLLLADFGFAASIASTRRLKLLCGSPHYSAPEIFAQREYVGTQADLWSTGVLIYTFLAGHFPFQADSMDALGRKVLRGKWDKPLPASDAARDLVRRMLAVPAVERATLEEVCSHAWVLDGARSAAEVIPSEGEEERACDEAAVAELDAIGCNAALVRHHVEHGTRNHVTAAHEVICFAPPLES